jgi:hypothetical protein
LYYLQIKFGPSEFVTEISGSRFAGTAYFFMTNLKIVTNVKTYGPFGTGLGVNPFNAVVPANKTVVGFFACVDHGTAVFSIRAIGVYTI